MQTLSLLKGILGDFMTFLVMVLTVHLLSFPVSISMNQKMDPSVHFRKQAKFPGNCSQGPFCPLASLSSWAISAADSWGALGWDISRLCSSSATSAQIVSRSQWTLTETPELVRAHCPAAVVKTVLVWNLILTGQRCVPDS